MIVLLKVQCLQYLLSAGCEIKTDHFGDTPIHVAEIYDHKECTQLIREHNTNVNSTVKTFQTDLSHEPDNACNNTSKPVTHIPNK